METWVPYLLFVGRGNLTKNWKDFRSHCMELLSNIQILKNCSTPLGIFQASVLLHSRNMYQEANTLFPAKPRTGIWILLFDGDDVENRTSTPS